MTRQTETTQTEHATAGTDGRTTMADVNHTNPYTGKAAERLFSRGPIVRADGGRAADEVRTTDDEPDGGAKRMKDVSHTPPKDADDANRVFERGGSEPATERVEGDE